MVHRLRQKLIYHLYLYALEGDVEQLEVTIGRLSSMESCFGLKGSVLGGQN